LADYQLIHRNNDAATASTNLDPCTVESKTEATYVNLLLVVESGIDVRLVEALQERFHLSILARRIVGGVEISQASSVPVSIGPSSRVRFALAVASRIWRSRTRTEFVLVQGYSLAALASNLSGRLLGIPTAMLVCSPVEAYYLCRRGHPEAGKQFRRYELTVLAVLARLNALLGGCYVVLSQHLADVMKKHGAKRSFIIPVYGVDTNLFSPVMESKLDLRSRLGLPVTGKIIFFSSRVAPEKDSETLLQAFRGLVEQGRDLWLLHRSGGFRNFVEAAEAHGVSNRVLAGDALHPVTELPAHYQASDLCVQASREEGLGFSPLEALACQIPVIATSVGGLKETIIDGLTGWSYPVGDSVSLARAIVQALDDPAEAARRSREGRKLVCSRYERNLVFQELVTLIQSVVQRGGW